MAKKLPINYQRFTIRGGENSFSINLDGGIRRLQISFPESQDISVNNFSIKGYRDDFSMADYLASVEKLKSNSIRVSHHGPKEIIGELNSNTSGVLFFSVPFDIGWSLKVDGKSQQIFNVNNGFIGAIVEPGLHSIELTYNLPYLRFGALITVLTLLFGFTIFLYKRVKDKKHES
jgi:uncharacterized membrane protein YfhO